jgi:hypothetical protein
LAVSIFARNFKVQFKFHGKLDVFAKQSHKKLLKLSHRVLNKKSVKKLKLSKQKPPTRWQLFTFGCLILNF